MAASRSQASSRGSSGALTKTIYVRVTDSEHAAFTKAADAEQMSTAEWARRVLRSVCPPMTVTLPVITGPGGRAPLVAEVVDPDLKF